MTPKLVNRIGLRPLLATLLLGLLAGQPLDGSAQPDEDGGSGTAANDARFAGEVAVITGTSSGLGRELARLAADRDMRLVLVDIDAPPSEAFAERVRSQGGEAVFVQADLADPAQRSRVIDTAVERFGTVDYLFNNAGYAYLATLEQLDLDAAHRLFEVNYWAYADLARQVIPLMKQDDGGTIVNVASILGHRAAPPGLGHYAATKHALVGLFRAAAQELEPYGIEVYVASPGGMATNIWNNAVGPLADPSADAASDWEDPAIPARDIFEALGGEDVVFHPGYVGQQLEQDRTTPEANGS